MVDSSATNLFINCQFISANCVATKQLNKEIPLYNINGSKNQAGFITEFAELTMEINGHKEKAQFLVTELGPEDVILGITWLRQHNPLIDWLKGTMELNCGGKDRSGVCTKNTEDPIAPQKVNANCQLCQQLLRDKVMAGGKELWVCAGYTYAQKLAKQAKKDEKPKTFKEIVPEPY